MRVVAGCFVVGLVSLCAAACDRIAEPVTTAEPHPLTTTPSAIATGEPARCVKAWGPKPKREPFVAGFVAPDCPDKEPADTPPAPKDPLRTGTIVFSEATGAASPPSITVEVADSPKTRQRGLMMRRSMPENRGMIFVFQEKKVQEFWMHNTCIPLDMMFIDKDGLIVGIEENVPTMSDDTFSVSCPSTYVLEVNAGWSRSHGVAPGQKVLFQGI
jgi:uncharacterized membrane protein (UPF0127 family)